MTRPRRYWAIRTDRRNRELIYRELGQGRLRQGWGWDPSQDLRLVQAKLERGEDLTQTEEAALPNLRMLTSRDDGVKPRDWILLPNLPDPRFFVIAEVTGDYYYEPVQLPPEHDHDGFHQDYGHILPVRLLTGAINKDSEHVHASIRATLKTRSRMWSLDRYAKEIEELLEKANQGVNLSQPQRDKERLESALEKAWAKVAPKFQEELENELKTRFQAAEWEGPIRQALERLYPGAEVEWVGGPQEEGADVVVYIPDHFSEDGQTWVIPVQVKNYTGEIGASVLNQLRRAFNAYSQEGRVLSLVVMTTAERASKELQEAAAALSEELGVPVRLVLREKLLDLLAEAFHPSAE